MTTLTICETRAPVELADKPIQEWIQPDGAIWATCHRVPGGYVMRFPEFADFEISRDAHTVVCHPVAETEAQTIEHLYLNQVLPMVLGRQGTLTFHGSAVEVDAGAVAFMGQSGLGKSTLALSFATNGFRFLADDGLVIDDAGEQVIARPSHPSIRLWQDSKDALSPRDADEASALPYTAKCRINAGGGIVFCDEPRPLSAVFILEDEGARDVQLERIRPADALIRWVRHSFMLDVEDDDLVAGHFERVSRLVTKIPCYSLDFPRRFDQLPDLRQMIVEHARSQVEAA